MREKISLKKESESRERKEKIFETRKKITEALLKELEKSTNVLALSLDGSDIDKSFDEYSDIDFRVVVKNGKAQEVNLLIEALLIKFLTIETKYTHHREGGNFQALYQFGGDNKFLIVDVIFLEEKDNVNKELKVLFDKEGAVKRESIKDKDQKSHNKERVENYKIFFNFRNTYIERELNRGNFLEAFKQYQFFLLEKLVEALRLLHCPEKSALGLKRISKDLPADVVKDVEDLFQVTSLEELKNKYKKASQLFLETISKLEMKFLE